MRSIVKPELRQAFWTGVALTLVVGAFAAFVWLIALAIREGATVLAAILAAFATVAAALVARHFERRKDVDAARRGALGGLYEDLASVLAGLDMPERKREKVITGFIRKGLIYSSPRTLKAFRDWRASLAGMPPDADDWPLHLSHQNMLLYEAFVKSMRKDLGVSNWLLQDGDLGRAMNSDWDDHFHPIKLEASRQAFEATIQHAAEEATSERTTR